MVNYKACILAAGAGTRMGPLSDDVNKSILPVNFKATISHIIEKFPPEVELVIAVGHKKETVKDYLAIAHPERKITYVEIDKFIGPGTGPGYSLLKCRDYLKCPFVFMAADTLVLEKIPEPTENWCGIAPVKETEPYCTVKIKNNLIYQFDDKIKCDNKYAFLGVAGIKDYDFFFNTLEKDKEIKSGEIQVSNGLSGLIEKSVTPVGFTWFDTGTLENYKETNRNFLGGNKQFDFTKTGEFIYFVNGKVIKFFADKDITDKRVTRAKHLSGLVPEIESKSGNFYSYKRIDGQVLYDILNRQLVRDFFQWAKLNLWKEKKLNSEQEAIFRDACKKFYHEKTAQRLQKFYEKTGIEDGPENINGIHVPSLKEMMEKTDWEMLYKGTPTSFHGDLQFDNVLVTVDPQSNLKKFVLIDWRHEFGGVLEYGDIYYDLAKIYGGIILQYPLIRDNKFSFDMSGSSIYYNFYLKNNILETKEEFESFVKRNSFDMDKIKLLTSIIFLNMSPLLQDTFGLMVYYLGKYQFYHTLQDMGAYKK